MNVHCSTCNEPWNTFHLWHDAVFETDLSPEEAHAWESLPQSGKLSDRYREKFRDIGFEFGRSVINVVRCPCCPKDAQVNSERAMTKAALEDLFGEDEDALAVTFEDYKL